MTKMKSLKESIENAKKIHSEFPQWKKDAFKLETRTMTKPDTKEIRTLILKYDSALANGECISGEWDKFTNLCDAYNEAQKEIERLNTLIKFQGEISVEKTQRISILEGLLKKVLELDDGTRFLKYKNDLLLFCPLCFEEDGCKDDCLSWEIKKELGEG